MDDSSLINNIHYPYELAHYKNSMKFKSISISEYIQEPEVEELVEIMEGIGNNPLLEKIIPPKWHAFVNELIHNYEMMDDSSFYEKYKELIGIDQIWFLLQEYEKENENKNLLGSLIVFAMTEKEYILQLDYKEDVAECYSSIKNYWNNPRTRLVQFILNNDQNYYAMVPIDTNIEKMYEVTVKEVK